MVRICYRQGTPQLPTWAVYVFVYTSPVALSHSRNVITRFTSNAHITQLVAQLRASARVCRQTTADLSSRDSHQSGQNVALWVGNYWFIPVELVELSDGYYYMMLCLCDIKDFVKDREYLCWFYCNRLHIILYYNDRRMKQKLYFDVATHVYLLTDINGFYYNKFLWLSL